MSSLDLPQSAGTMIRYNTRYDNRHCAEALAGTGIEAPRLPAYIDKLWHYWVRNLDPALAIDGRSVGTCRFGQPCWLRVRLQVLARRVPCAQRRPVLG